MNRDMVNVEVSTATGIAAPYRRLDPANKCAEDGCWDFSSTGKVELLGKVCESVKKAPNAKVNIVVGCQTILAEAAGFGPPVDALLPRRECPRCARLLRRGADIREPGASAAVLLVPPAVARRSRPERAYLRRLLPRGLASPRGRRYTRLACDRRARFRSAHREWRRSRRIGRDLGLLGLELVHSARG